MRFDYPVPVVCYCFVCDRTLRDPATQAIVTTQRRAERQQVCAACADLDRGAPDVRRTDVA